jgi:phosphoribosylformimino-5-aminoimidazole carboxamide ribotide isomerase
VIAIPCVDVSARGRVQIGSGATSRSPSADPPSIARAWSQFGFRRLHVVDVDAAGGGTPNLPLLEEVLRASPIEIQVGGGVRSLDDVERLYQAGVEHVVIGGPVLEDPASISEISALYPGLLVVAADVRGRRVIVRGRGRTTSVDAVELVEELNSLNVGGVLFTATHQEGQMRGPDLTLIEDVVEAADFPVIASGGVASLSDLRALEHRGAWGTIVGTALYSGALDPRAVASEFAE